MTSLRQAKLKADLDALYALTEHMLLQAQSGQTKEEDLQSLNEKCSAIRDKIGLEDLREVAALTEAVMKNLGKLIPHLQSESKNLREALDGMKTRTRALQHYTRIEHSRRERP